MKEHESWVFDTSVNYGINIDGDDHMIKKVGSDNCIRTDAEEAPVMGKKQSSKANKQIINCDDQLPNKIGESEHEMHIWTERERRKKMRNMFSCLHDLLPQLPAKADKSTIVDEAVNYIKTLENTLEKMRKQEKLQLSPIVVPFINLSTATTSTQTQSFDSREAFLANKGPSDQASFQLSAGSNCFQTWLSPNVVISTCGNDAHFNICTPKKPGLLTTILYILEKHNLNLLSAHVSSDQHRNMFMIHANASHQVQDQALSIEEIFKLAAGEMNLWFLTC